MKRTIAYFSAEYSVADNLPIYAGGLGILAGDTVQEAGDEKRDFYALGLVYHEAFTFGDTDTTSMVSRLSANGFKTVAGQDNQPLTVSIPLDGEQVEVRAWRKTYGTAQLILLDTHLETNSAAAQSLSNRLYDNTPGIMLRQQIILGFGGVAMLEAMGIEPDIYHLNEGHMAFAGLAVVVARQRHDATLSFADALMASRHKLVATKHTILAGAGLMPDRRNLEVALQPLLKNGGETLDQLMKLGAKPDGNFSTTKFLLAIASRHSGVSAIHVAAEAKDHSSSPLTAITNGVYAPRWRAANLGSHPLQFDDANLWQTHNENRRNLLEYVKATTGQQLDPNRLTVVWARRMTAYKRPELLVNNLKRLALLAHHAQYPIQFVMSGQANPADTIGIELMGKVVAASVDPDLAGSFAYLPHYNPKSARLLVQGADLWLNTPIRGMEACGTSGMKASLNGALQFSTSDGWIDEIDLAPIGWELPVRQPETALYDILEHQIAPLFYQHSSDLPTGWIAKMRANIQLIEQQFTSTRMLSDYYDKLYQ